MNGTGRLLRVVLAVGGLAGIASWPQPRAAAAGGSYEDLVRLFEQWRAFQQPRIANGVPDYTAAAMERQRLELPRFESRLAAIDASSWPIAQQADWQLVRAEMNGLDFDHRVLRPWSRNPCFYAVLHESQSDTPAHEGHVQAAALELWQHGFPLAPSKLQGFRTALRAIPPILEQARSNLVEEARDLWLLGIRVKARESATLASLARTLEKHHPELVPDAERARRAVDEFRAWLEVRAKTMTAPSGVGVANYDWYLRNVHLSPYTWAEEVALVKRELGRAYAQLRLEENRNRALPKLEPIATAAEWQRRFGEAVTEYMRFLREQRILTVADHMDGALRERGGGFVPPDQRDFFAQVDHRDPIVMRCHGSHWFDLARMAREPHPSPIRRGPLLYNIWDSRAEGLATAMEEMMMTAGLLEGRPRSRELVYVLVANRAARALAGLKQHSRELGVGEAMRLAHELTPNGWLLAEGETNWAEQQLYLEQPGYGTSYLAGKAQIEKLIADRSRQLGAGFSIGRLMDEMNAAGMIPVSLIRWETTGLDDEIRQLR